MCPNHPAGLGRGTTHCGDKGNEVQGWEGESARTESLNLCYPLSAPWPFAWFFCPHHWHFPPVTEGDDIFCIFSRSGETDLEEKSL